VPSEVAPGTQENADVEQHDTPAAGTEPQGDGVVAGLLHQPDRRQQLGGSKPRGSAWLGVAAAGAGVGFLVGSYIARSLRRGTAAREDRFAGAGAGGRPDWRADADARRAEDHQRKRGADWPRMVTG
jgi:hypothetical protein